MPYNPFFNPYQGQAQQQANGLIAIQSEMEARSYPVAPGNTLLFKHQILIKDLSNKTNGGKYLRLAVRNTEDNDQLLAALREELG